LKAAGGAAQPIGAAWILDPSRDCKAWSSASATDFAAVYDEGNQKFSMFLRDSPDRFLCCE
jgi:hypothetical protein